MINVIFFDFDGVILDSMTIRDYGFREILDEHPKDLVDSLIEYHHYNAGLSRFVKIRYFYEELLGRSISSEKVDDLAQEFSKIMRSKLIKREYLIEEAVNFIKNNHKKYKMHIVSGSEQDELRFLCEILGIADYFITINGSPTPKNQLVADIITGNEYDPKAGVLIGDSINDYEAANINGLRFYGYNNDSLRDLSTIYLDEFSAFSEN